MDGVIEKDLESRDWRIKRNWDIGWEEENNFNCINSLISFSSNICNDIYLDTCEDFLIIWVCQQRGCLNVNDNTYNTGKVNDTLLIIFFYDLHLILLIYYPVKHTRCLYLTRTQRVSTFITETDLYCNCRYRTLFPLSLDQFTKVVPYGNWFF